MKRTRYAAFIAALLMALSAGVQAGVNCDGGHGVFAGDVSECQDNSNTDNSTNIDHSVTDESINVDNSDHRSFGDVGGDVTFGDVIHKSPQQQSN